MTEDDVETYRVTQYGNRGTINHEAEERDILERFDSHVAAAQCPRRLNSSNYRNYRAGRLETQFNSMVNPI